MAGIYEKVRERLDQFPEGFPKTQSGVEMATLCIFLPDRIAVHGGETAR
jgi:hypothetical protein